MEENRGNTFIKFSGNPEQAMKADTFDILNDSEFMLKLGWNIQQTQFKKKVTHWKWTFRDFLGGPVVKNLPANAGDKVQSLVGEERL